MSSIPAPATEAEAIEMVLTGLSRLAAADPAAMAAQAQAECLLALEQGDAMSTAVRARFLAAFTAGRGYSADGDYSPASWLIHQTRVTRGAARSHRAWARRAEAHPRVVAALAEGSLLTESVARIICGWTGRLPADCQDAADEILVGAALAGGRPEDLAVLAAEIYAGSLPAGDDNPEPDFEDRQVRVETTFAGAGVMSGDLTPECAAVVTTVLDALSAPAGAQDTRTREQRYHDALEDAIRRLPVAGTTLAFSAITRSAGPRSLRGFCPMPLQLSVRGVADRLGNVCLLNASVWHRTGTPSGYGARATSWSGRVHC